MRRQIKHFYEFDGFRVDVIERVLLRDGEMVALTQKAFEVLLALVECHGQIVEKGALMNRVWPDSFVEEGNLAQNIYTLRKALGQTPDGDEYIKTVPRRGYRFVANVRESRDEGEQITAPAQTVVEPEVSQASGLAVERVDVTSSVASGRRARPKTTVMIVGSVLIIVAAAVTIYSVIGRVGGGSNSAELARKIGITNLTTTGNITCAAVSPDGKYVAYGVADKLHLSSLWVMQLATSTSQQIIPPAEMQYRALTFSPDGNQIYYVTREDELRSRTLYCVSMMGGPPRKVMEGVETNISFSPDGKQFVFRRGSDERRESALIIARADGTEEKQVAAIEFPEFFGAPAWSPDGKVIACATGHAEGGLNMYVTIVQTEGWTAKPISHQKWRWVGQMGWSPSSDSLVMVASDHAAEPYQVWQVAYPSGEAQRITQDSNFYNLLSISADARTMVALQRRQVSNVWLIPRGDASRAKQITFGTGGYRGKLSWTPDGKIVYDSEVGSTTAISMMEADGSNPKQLLGDLAGRARVGYVVASGDGRYIIFTSDLTGTKHIWRMNVDGSNPVQLTNGTGEDHPTVSPDGKWVVYVKMETRDSERPTLWKVPIDGGAPVPLTTGFTSYPSISPDGKLIACLYSEATGPSRLALFPFAGGQPIKVFATQVTAAPYIRWTPDGRHLTYAENPIGPSKLWLQPLDGSPPKQLAEFETDRVFGFDWSRDGNYLACVRGLWATDAALIRGFD